MTERKYDGGRPGVNLPRLRSLTYGSAYRLADELQAEREADRRPLQLIGTVADAALRSLWPHVDGLLRALRQDSRRGGRRGASGARVTPDLVRETGRAAPLRRGSGARRSSPAGQEPPGAAIPIDAAGADPGDPRGTAPPCPEIARTDGPTATISRRSRVPPHPPAGLA